MYKGIMGRSALAASALLLSVTAASEEKVFGWLEKTTLEPWGIVIKAKLDSGALTSSLDARDIELFEKDGSEWVRFRLELGDEDNGETLAEELERPLYRNLTVRGAGGRDERPVVLMKVCLDDTIHEEQFSLRDRSEMNYPMLLGRRTIEHLGLLDVKSTYRHVPECDEDAPVKQYMSEDET